MGRHKSLDQLALIDTLAHRMAQDVKIKRLQTLCIRVRMVMPDHGGAIVADQLAAIGRRSRMI